MNPSDVLPGLPLKAKILFIRLRSLGDTILSIPLYTALKNWRPDLGISVLVEEPNDQVIANNPCVDHIISIPAADGSNWKVFRARLSALANMRQSRFDCCINLHGGSTSACLTALSGARYRVGYRGFRNAFVYNLRVGSTTMLSPGMKSHTVEHQIEWLRALGLPKAEIPPSRVIPNPQFEAVVKDRLTKAGLKADSRYAVIQPTSKFYTKEWTAEGFAEIADYLGSRFGLSVMLTAGPGRRRQTKHSPG